MANIVVHPAFELIENKNDIGLVIVRRRIREFKDFVQRIPVTNILPYSGLQCTALGWGRVLQVFNTKNTFHTRFILEFFKGGPFAAEAIYVNLTIMDGEFCHLQYKMHDGHLCALDVRLQGSDCCQGDSGGPLICSGMLTGIVSYGYGCGTLGVPGFFTDVYHYSAWIAENSGAGIKRILFFNFTWVLTIGLWNFCKILK